jgi:hypothetical protein
LSFFQYLSPSIRLRGMGLAELLLPVRALNFDSPPALLLGDYVGAAPPAHPPAARSDAAPGGSGLIDLLVTATCQTIVGCGRRRHGDGRDAMPPCLPAPVRIQPALLWRGGRGAIAHRIAPLRGHVEQLILL